MVEKKCPKCREHNPVEAVICWSCYTPLDSAYTAPAPRGTVAAPRKSIALGDDEALAPKAAARLDSRWLGAGAAAVLVLLVFAGFKMFGGSQVTDDSDPGGPVVHQTVPGSNVVASQPASYPVSPAATLPASTSAAVVPVSDIPYTVVASPNPLVDYAVMGILPRQITNNPRQAAGLALFARRQFVNLARWKRMDIFVFDDAGAAHQFADYQSHRSSQPLGAGDYAALIPVWVHTPALYRSEGTRVAVASPAADPERWWQTSARVS